MKFQSGDKVKTKYGEYKKVLWQDGLKVFTGCNEWYHPNNLVKL